MSAGTSQMYWKTYHNGFNRYIVYHHSNMILFTNNPSMEKKHLSYSLPPGHSHVSHLPHLGQSEIHRTISDSLSISLRNGMWRTCEQLISRTVVWQTAVVLSSAKSWEDPEKILNLQDLIDHQSPNLKSMRYCEMLSTQGTSGHLSFKQGSWV